jgi:CheY-like chemotaxis protein
LLDGIGITPTFTENGKEALEVWQIEPFDVVLMDMQMPIMDGLTAMRLMRQIEAEKHLPRMPIVALTANAMGHQIHEQIEAGADAHAAKPIQLPALIAAIEEAIDRCDAINSGHLKLPMAELDDDQLPSAAADKAA